MKAGNYRGKEGKEMEAKKQMVDVLDVFFFLFLRMQVVTNEMKKHMTQGDGLYVYAAWSLKLPIVPHHHLLPG